MLPNWSENDSFFLSTLKNEVNITVIHMLYMRVHLDIEILIVENKIEINMITN